MGGLDSCVGDAGLVNDRRCMDDDGNGTKGWHERWSFASEIMMHGGLSLFLIDSADPFCTCALCSSPIDLKYSLSAVPNY